MSIETNDSSASTQFVRPELRSSQGPMSSDTAGEGCPVIEESGTVCSETKTLAIINEFREIYEECLRKMDGCGNDNGLLVPS